MSKENILKNKSFDFAVRIIKLYKYLRKRYTDWDLSQQILRSGTAVGALIREAEYAKRRKDFMHKLHIGIKEANECAYWLELVYATDYITKRMFDSIQHDAVELLKMLTASIKTTKRKIQVL